MLSGDNSLLKRAAEAKEKTKEATAKEQIQMEVLGCYATENLKLDKDKLKTNLGNIGAKVTEAGNSLMVSLDGETYEVDNKGNVKKASDEYLARNGIEVGDYITYIPPTDNGTVRSYELTVGACGYTEKQTLTQQYNIWRVLNKNADGSLDIMPSFTKTDLPQDTTDYTTIYFNDAKGWNNAPYLLDDMCSKLYADEEKGITARSIDFEDITSHMIEGVEGATSEESTGLKKISKYQSEIVARLVTGTYIDGIDSKNNTVTYKTRTTYPTLYFDVKNNESNPYYTSSTIDVDSSTNGRIGTKPATLSVKYTLYIGTIASTDFDNGNAYNVIFGTETSYWLASRCCYCNKNEAGFGIRRIEESKIKTGNLFYSMDWPGKDSYRVSPIVTLSSNVQVTKCVGDNSENNRHTVVIN